MAPKPSFPCFIMVLMVRGKTVTKGGSEVSLRFAGNVGRSCCASCRDPNDSFTIMHDGLSLLPSLWRKHKASDTLKHIYLRGDMGVYYLHTSTRRYATTYYVLESCITAYVALPKKNRRNGHDTWHIISPIDLESHLQPLGDGVRR